MNGQETISDIIAGKRFDATTRDQFDSAYIVDFCDRLEAALKRELGDCAKLRKALKTTLDLFWDIHNANRSPQSNQAYAVIKQIKAALSAPPRNCDVGTAEEQAERYGRYCDKFTSDGMHYENCPCCGKIPFGKCEFAWAQMPYEEGGAK